MTWIWKDIKGGGHIKTDAQREGSRRSIILVGTNTAEEKASAQKESNWRSMVLTDTNIIKEKDSAQKKTVKGRWFL